jgi:hypothetical protein
MNSIAGFSIEDFTDDFLLRFSSAAIRKTWLTDLERLNVYVKASTLLHSVLRIGVILKHKPKNAKTPQTLKKAEL